MEEDEVSMQKQLEEIHARGYANEMEKIEVFRQAIVKSVSKIRDQNKQLSIELNQAL